MQADIQLILLQGLVNFVNERMTGPKKNTNRLHSWHSYAHTVCVSYVTKPYSLVVHTESDCRG